MEAIAIFMVALVVLVLVGFWVFLMFVSMGPRTSESDRIDPNHHGSTATPAHPGR